MKKFIYLFIPLFFTFLSINELSGQQTICDRFNTGINGWQSSTAVGAVNGVGGVLGPTGNDDGAFGISTNVPNSPPGVDGTPYLFVNDGNGPSYLHKIMTTEPSRDFSCATFNYDYNAISDGNSDTTDVINHAFFIYSGGNIHNSTLRARWNRPNTITENTGWINVTINTAFDQMPVGWTIINGANTLANWQALISNVSGYGFSVDIGQGSQHLEDVGLDNFCVTQNSLPISNFDTEDAFGTIQDDFCVNQNIILNGSGSFFDTSNRFTLWRVNPNGSTSWVYNSPPFWGPGTTINVTQLLANNNNPIQLAAGDYQIIGVVGNACDGWVPDTVLFTIHDLPRPEFTIETCRIGDELELTVNGLGNGSGYFIEVYTTAPGDPCVTSPLPSFLTVSLSNTLTTTLPYVEGQCLVIRYWVHDGMCSGETVETYLVPEIPDLDPTIDPTPNSQTGSPNWYTWSFISGFPSNFNTLHNWTVQVSETEDPYEWTPSNLVWGLGSPQAGAILSSEKYYRICHDVRLDSENFCSRSSTCIIIEARRGSSVNIVSEDGNITTIDLEDIREVEEEVVVEEEEVGDRKRLEGEEQEGITDASSELELYPNPVANKLNIKVGKISAEGNIHLQVTDVLGAVHLTLTKEIHPNSTIQISSDNLGDGIYFLTVRYPNGTSKIKKFMVRH